MHKNTIYIFMWYKQHAYDHYKFIEIKCSSTTLINIKKVFLKSNIYVKQGYITKTTAALYNIIMYGLRTLVNN